MNITDILKELGINVGLSVAGLFGSLVMVGGTSAYEIRKTLVSILSGVCSANYLTPIATELVTIHGLNTNTYQFALAFLFGFLGLKGIEFMSDKLFKKKK